MSFDNNTKFIVVAGYGWSGSSAIIDLLKEYEGLWQPDVEFRVIKDPYGLIDLSYNLFDRVDPINNDIAIKDFLWVCKHFNRRSTRLQCGLNYEELIGKSFMEETYKFVSELTNFEYNGRWWLMDFKLSKYDMLIRKIKHKLKINVEDKLYFTNITKEEYNALAKKYLISLFNSISNEDNIDTIVLDQAIPAVMPEKINDYFENAKLLIIDRDPRDIYVDLIQYKGLIGKDLAEPGNVLKYIDWHRRLRNKKELPYVKYMQFEDIVTNYDESIYEIEEFLGLKKENHIKKKLFFDPEVSKKNIGIWKNFERQDDIRIIENELKAELYEG